MEKDQSEIEVGSELGNDPTAKEKTMAVAWRSEAVDRAMKEGKPFSIACEVYPMRTLEEMEKRGLIKFNFYPPDSDSEDEDEVLEPDTSGKRKHSNKNKTAIGLPFKKKSDCWKEYEADEAYNRTATRPHFRPLFYSLPLFRETVASALTHHYIDLVKKVDNLGKEVPRSELEHYKLSFALLEDHGFDVRAPLLHIDQLTDESNKEPKLNQTVLVSCSSKTFAREKVAEKASKLP